MSRETVAADLALACFKYCQTHNLKPFINPYSPSKSKWWKFLLATADRALLEQLPEWDAYKFVSSQFERDPDVLPFKFIYKDAWDYYILCGKRDDAKESSAEKNAVYSIKDCMLNIKQWAIKYNNGKLDFPLYVEYLDAKERWAFERPSPFIIVSSKTVMKGTSYNSEKVERMQKFIKKSKVLVALLSELLGEDFMWRKM